MRTSNKPLGDTAEQIVLAARGGVLEPNSTKSHDATSLDGRRIQVKAMGARKVGRAGTFSPFRSFGFDTAVFLVFAGETFEIVLAREVPGADSEAVGSGWCHLSEDASHPQSSQTPVVGTSRKQFGQKCAGLELWRFLAPAPSPMLCTGCRTDHSLRRS